MARAPSPDPAFAYAGPAYGSVGILTGFALTPLLGLLLATVAATLGGHRGILRAIGILGIIVGVHARRRPATLRSGRHQGRGQAPRRCPGVALAWAWLGLRGWRQSRMVGGTDGRSGAASLVVR